MSTVPAVGVSIAERLGMPAPALALLLCEVEGVKFATRNENMEILPHHRRERSSPLEWLPSARMDDCLSFIVPGRGPGSRADEAAGDFRVLHGRQQARRVHHLRNPVDHHVRGPVQGMRVSLEL